MSARHAGLAQLLAQRTPVAAGVVTWPGGIRLQIAAYAYAGPVELPSDLVVSVRCLVTVQGRVLVVEDAESVVDVLPGGRCEPGESWAETAQREVMEETGWSIDPSTLEMLGFIHLEHITPVPPGHHFPHPDFLQVVMHGEASGAPVDWVDTEGWVRRSWLESYDDARALPLTIAGSAFLALVG